MTAAVTLVLGSGGPVAHAYEVGALLALERALDWDPRAARRVIGTSAGAQVAALLRAGMSAEDLYRRVRGEPLSPYGEAVAAHYVRPPHDAPGRKARWRPASPLYLQRAARRPWRAHVGHVVSALLPEGQVSLEPQAVGLRALFNGGWADAELWIVATCLDTGQRVAFGRAGDPRTDVGTAVAASGAVPGLCVPVAVDERTYVDGGIVSACHADLVAEGRQDVAIVINPLSLFPPLRLTVRRELRRARRRGDRVLLLEPNRRARRVMGLNPMDTRRAPAIAEAALETVSERLRSPAARALLASLAAVAPAQAASPSQVRSSK